MNLVVKFISPLRVEIWVAALRSKENITLEGLRDHHMELVQDWVEQLELGHRMAFNQWKLHNESAMSAFVLYWHGKQIDK
jgi:hypothetical protein